MNILFRCDSSDKIGQGHIRRDIILAKRLKKENKIFFAVRDLPKNANYLIDEAGFEKIILKSNDFEELKETIQKNKIDFLIIDHYEIDLDFEQKLKTLKIKTAAFDDFYAPHTTDIVINPNLFANKKRYSQEVWIPFPLIDERFFIKKKRFPKKPNKVLIAFGGSDPKNCSVKILKQLPKKWQITIVTTSSNKNLRKLKKIKNIKLIIDSKNMPKLFKEHDIALISASTLSIEAIASKTPFIAIKTAQNQQEVFRFLKRKRFKILNKLKKIKISAKEYKIMQNRAKLFRLKRQNGD